MHAVRTLSNKQALPARAGASRPARANKAATSVVVPRAKLNDDVDDEEGRTSTFSRIAAAAMASLLITVASPHDAAADALSGSAYSKVSLSFFSANSM